MEKFALNYNELETSVKETKKKVFKYADVQNKLIKVAYDIVRFKDNDVDGLWKIETTKDGDVIIALYEEQSISKEASINDWKAIANTETGNVQLFYKNDPITQINVEQFGLDKSEAYLSTSYLPKKLASNGKMVHYLLSNLHQDVRDEIYHKYPELAGKILG